jgi:hypothetical protein
LPDLGLRTKSGLGCLDLELADIDPGLRKAVADCSAECACLLADDLHSDLLDLGVVVLDLVVDVEIPNSIGRRNTV